MKKSILLILSLFVPLMTLAQVKWMTIAEALEAQKKEPKKILIDFYADWCEPCKLMDQNTYNHPHIVKIINENFYPVKFRSDGNDTIQFAGHTFINADYDDSRRKNPLHQFTKYMNINMIPSVVFLDEKTKPITNLAGYLKAKELEPFIQLIATNEYKNFTTRKQWEDYHRKFKSKIKE